MILSSKNDLREKRDKALISLACDSLCRRSELISLMLSDIDFDRKGIPVRVKLRKSKTDQEAIGETLFISPETQWLVKYWGEAAKISERPLFRGVKNNGDISSSLSAGQVNRIFKRLAVNANIPRSEVKQISGHSLRIGAAQDLVNSGASLPQLMSRGRWSKAKTALRYGGCK